MIQSRAKSIIMWLGLLSTVLLAGGVEFSTLTSWKLLVQAVLSIISNPVALVAVIINVMSIVANPTTPGITDPKEE